MGLEVTPRSSRGTGKRPCESLWRRKSSQNYDLSSTSSSLESRLRNRCRVMAWIDATDESMLYLSVLRLGEIRKGLAALPQGRRRTILATWLEVALRARFNRKILSIGSQVAECWGWLASTAKRGGKGALCRRWSPRRHRPAPQPHYRLPQRHRLRPPPRSSPQPVATIIPPQDFSRFMKFLTALRQDVQITARPSRKPHGTLEWSAPERR